MKSEGEKHLGQEPATNLRNTRQDNRTEVIQDTRRETKTDTRKDSKTGYVMPADEQRRDNRQPDMQNEVIRSGGEKTRNMKAVETKTTREG
jgi:hypothetical protein